MHTFVHPGTFMSPSMTRTLVEDAKTNPIRMQALQKLMRDVPSTYIPSALEVVDVDWNGKGVGGKECTSDGEAAVGAALIYWATRDQNYGTLCISILRAWAKTNKVFKGNNAPLNASWAVCSMARAAELMKYSPMWREWMAIEVAFFNWLNNVVSKPLRDTSVWRWGFVNNWHFSIVCARMQIAILLEDEKEWAWAVSTYREILPKALCAGCKGDTVELRRDITHNQFLLGGMMQAAEIAHHQGVDLFDERLINCFETQARLLMRHDPKELQLKKQDIKTPYGYWPEPIYEIAIAHFCDRKRKDMPFTKQLLQSVKHCRPDKITFHWGGNTLTHFERCK